MNVAAALRGVFCAVIAAGVIVQTVRLADAQRTLAESVSERADVLLQIAEQRTAHEVAMREKSEQQHAALRAIALIHEQEQQDAQQAHDQVVADLRAGLVRLRDLWTGCGAAGAANLPATTTAAGSPDAAADLRAEAAGRIVRAGAACDAQVRGLQGVIRTYQQPGSDQ